MSDHDIAIIGGGLSGLTAATLLHQQGRDVTILEASTRLGGRIDSVRDANGTPIADLGPTWIWPPYQPSAAQWVQTLNLETFEQYNTGDAIIDIDPSQTHRQSLPGQHGMARITGGPQAIIDAMATTLTPDQIMLNTPITALNQSGKTITLHHPKGTSTANHVILAAPLRRIASGIELGNLLPHDVKAALPRIPTWMASQIKVAITYDTPFWRESGLSGRIASRIGPMGEVHDISARSGPPAALFGFVANSDLWRGNPNLKAAILDQLHRCFGDAASNPATLTIRDWGDQTYICDQLDKDRPPDHPGLLPDVFRSTFANGRLHFAVAETAQTSPGLIDGALDSGMRAAAHLLQ